jgi:hypothetical protein
LSNIEPNNKENTFETQELGFWGEMLDDLLTLE